MDTIFKCVAFVFLVSAACSPASAKKPDDKQMTREAMSPFLRARMSLSDKQKARVQELHAAVRIRASNTPERDMSVTIIFSNGLSIAEVNALVNRYKLEVIDMHLKAPYNDSGVVQSFDVGSTELARYKGNFAARAKKAIGAIRYQLLTMAKTMPPDVAAAYREITKNQILVYRIEAYSQSQNIADLLDHSDIGLVSAEDADRGDRRIAHHKQMRARAVEIWKKIPPGNATVTRLGTEE